MANSEAQFHRELLDAFKKEGAHCFKASDRFKHGIPDLYVQYQGRALWIECKFTRVFIPSFRVQVNLSPHQSEFIRREQKAGGTAGWALCVRVERPKFWVMLAGNEIPTEKITDGSDALVQARGAGGTWDVSKLVNAIIRPPDHA